MSGERNYLRVRGEYEPGGLPGGGSWELPPRARRIRGKGFTVEVVRGTTSACAENTILTRITTVKSWNYLRVRGEYHKPGWYIAYGWELPPRARRIPRRVAVISTVVGTTSACAENTFPSTLMQCLSGNYLRVRGEYPARPLKWHSPWELPPRARRILPPNGGIGRKYGTTSACAENTHTRSYIMIVDGNYLRVRGEYYHDGEFGSPEWELPPRARRIPHEQSPHQDQYGTTSACAENTRSVTPNCWSGWNYLRVRGEYVSMKPLITSRSELPPRARRIPPHCRNDPTVLGTTSACAENTTVPKPR